MKQHEFATGICRYVYELYKSDLFQTLVFSILCSWLKCHHKMALCDSSITFVKKLYVIDKLICILNKDFTAIELKLQFFFNHYGCNSLNQKCLIGCLNIFYNVASIMSLTCKLLKSLAVPHM